MFQRSQRGNQVQQRGWVGTASKACKCPPAPVAAELGRAELRPQHAAEVQLPHIVQLAVVQRLAAKHYQPRVCMQGSAVGSVPEMLTGWACLASGEHESPHAPQEAAQVQKTFLTPAMQCVQTKDGTKTVGGALVSYSCTTPLYPPFDPAGEYCANECRKRANGAAPACESCCQARVWRSNAHKSSSGREVSCVAPERPPAPAVPHESTHLKDLAIAWPASILPPTPGKPHQPPDIK